MPRHRLRLTLTDTDPAIWREFEIDGGLPLRMLHLAIQVIMGWRESHLHQFIDADPLERMPPTARRWAPRSARCWPTGWGWASRSRRRRARARTTR